MVGINIDNIIGKIKNIFKRNSEDETPTENVTQGTQVQDVQSTQVQDVQSTQVQDVQNPFLEKKSIISKLPIKKIIIIAPIVVIVGLLASGIISIPINMQQSSQGEFSDFDLLNERLMFVEDQVDFILTQGVGTESGDIGKQGQTGPKGSQGITGDAGKDGKDGVGGIPIMLSSAGTKTILSKPLYIGVGGGSEDYELIKMVSPVDGIIKNLHIITSEGKFNDINDNVRGMLILNGEETELYCNVIQNKCSNIESIVEIKAGDALAIRIDKKQQILFGELMRVQASVIMEPAD